MTVFHKCTILKKIDMFVRESNIQYRYQSSNNNNREMHKRKNWNDINKTKMKSFLESSNGFYKIIFDHKRNDY